MKYFYKNNEIFHKTMKYFHLLRPQPRGQAEGAVKINVDVVVSLHHQLGLPGDKVVTTIISDCNKMSGS